MRRLLLLFVFLSSVTYAQVTITGTVVDPDNVTWTNGTYTVTLSQLGTVTTYFFNGASTPTTYSGNLNSSGAFTISLPPNNQISPIPTQWIFAFCPNMSAPCQTLPPQTLNTTQSISTFIAANLAAIRIKGGPFTQAYNDVEVAALPNNSYLNITTGANRCYALSWTVCGTGGSSGGTVTSVALVGSNTFFSSTPGTAVTASGTLNLDSQLLAQTANCLFAGPTTGSAATPTCRALVNADLPSGVLTPAWSAFTNPTGSLQLTMGAFASEFDYATALNPAFTWYNNTPALVGTPQASPFLNLCGTEWTGAGTSTKGCITFQFNPTAGLNAGGTFAFGYSGSGTGVYTTTFPGPMQAGASAAGVGGGFSIAEGTAQSATSAKDVCYGDSTFHGIECSYNGGSFVAVVTAPTSNTTNNVPKFSGTGAGLIASTVTDNGTTVSTTEPISTSATSTNSAVISIPASSAFGAGTQCIWEANGTTSFYFGVCSTQFSTGANLQAGTVTVANLSQKVANEYGGKCAMSSSTSCTITLATTYTTPVCIATQQSGTLTGGAVGCTVSGTTVTITAASSNSETWGALIFGDPN